MNTPQRLFTYLFAAGAVVAGSWLMLGFGVYLWGGLATVTVSEADGVNLKVPVPMALVHAAAATTQVVDLSDLEIDLEPEVQQVIEQWAPTIRQAVDELARVPNGTVLVDVVDSNEHVRVFVSGGKFRVHVDSDDTKVRVAIPTRSVRRLVRQMT